jgi:hypothetical protein
MKTRHVGTDVSSLTLKRNQKPKTEMSGHEIWWRTGIEDEKKSVVVYELAFGSDNMGSRASLNYTKAHITQR